MERGHIEPAESQVGRDTGSYDWQITPALVRTYIEGTGDDNPWYTSDSPLGGPIAPALILHSAPFRSIDWYLPNVYGNLHAREECDFFAPVMVGEKLRTRGLIADRYVKRDREYLVNETLVLNSDGRIVARQRVHQSFLIENGGGLAVDKDREKTPRRTSTTDDRGGDPLEAPMRTITEAMCMAFSGPTINYHTDRAAARDWGFPDIVVQGMLSVCLIGEMMTRRFGMGFFSGGRIDVKLVNVVWCGDRIGPRGRIVEHRAEGKLTRATVDVSCEKADGTKTIVGAASALESAA